VLPARPARFQELSAACLPASASASCRPAFSLERGMTWRLAIGSCGVTGTNFCSGDVEETGWLGYVALSKKIPRGAARSEQSGAQ